ncbi:MAG TPA: VOC family protein [Fimbriimonadales bacterium]|nr:VOC family protein [Fimbriimonadales bacterium]
MPTICHFEIPAQDMERASAFYRNIFSWDISPAPGMPNYWFVNTKSSDGNEGIGGAIMPKQQGGEIMMYFDVASVSDTTARVEQEGGEVLVPKTAVPSYGYFAVCQDTEGNTFGLWQPDPSAM